MEPLKKEFEEFLKESPLTFAEGVGYTPTMEQIKRLMYGSFMGGYIKAKEESLEHLKELADCKRPPRRSGGPVTQGLGGVDQGGTKEDDEVVAQAGRAASQPPVCTWESNRGSLAVLTPIGWYHIAYMTFLTVGTS